MSTLKNLWKVGDEVVICGNQCGFDIGLPGVVEEIWPDNIFPVLVLVSINDQDKRYSVFSYQEILPKD